MTPDRPQLDQLLGSPSAPDPESLLRLARGVRGSAQMAGLETIAGVFGKDGAFNVKELIVGVVGSRSFRYRWPGNGEVLR